MAAFQPIIVVCYMQTFGDERYLPIADFGQTRTCGSVRNGPEGPFPNDCIAGNNRNDDDGQVQQNTCLIEADKGSLAFGPMRD